MSGVTLILARADNGVIGDKGRIPWRIPEDMRRFRALTMGKAVVMGRKTWESLPKKPLDGRTNIVVTRDRTYAAPGAFVVHSVEEALECGAPGEIMIAGGAEIYREVLDSAARVELTEVHGRFEGDVSIPAFDSAVWRESARDEHATAEGLRYSYVTLVRK